VLSEGKFIKEWGRAGTAPGEFNVPHGLAMDSLGRLFVADRSNNRIQVFDQNGKFLFEWKQFGRPSGLYIDKSDVLYVTDSQSGDTYNRPYRQGIPVGSVKDGTVSAFIAGNRNAGLAVDKQGNGLWGIHRNENAKKIRQTLT
jgi:DNA-binding beta-propeller fold protein YncE